MKFFKKNWGNILFFIIILLLLIPQTAMPIKVFVTRLFSFSPSEVTVNERVVLKDYSWSLNNMTGEKVNLQESEGKVIFVNLWATWCPPCVAELPSLQKLYDSYSERVEFYFITSEEPTRIQEFIQKKGYNLPVYIENENAPKVLQTQSIPKTYLISKDGSIVIDKDGAADWNTEKVHKIIEELLKD